MMLIKMNAHLPPLAKDLAPDGNVCGKKYHIFCFVVAPVLHHKRILLDSLFIYIQRHI